MSTNIDSAIIEKANKWLQEPYDKETQEAVKNLIENDPTGLVDAFYKNLEFGTGGLRGIMGVGTNRMNKYTVGMATQGLANYMKQVFGNENLSMAIAYDCRNNSPYFAEITAQVMSANGIKVYMFDQLRPTPELSFAIRHFGCQSGVVITASHNPKEYNGYKAYWNDGSQLIHPHDKNVIHEVEQIKGPADVNFDGRPDLVHFLGTDFDQLYISQIKKLSLSSDLIKNYGGYKIVFTPIHGTAVDIVPKTLRAFGFEAVYNVPEQDIVDGNFPTVISPNPEESAALDMAIKKAMEVDAQIVMATDPDCDRVGIAVRDQRNQFILLNGNQAASLLIYYLLTKWKENGKLTGKEYIVKTIVTTELLFDIADSFGVERFDVLTGFKYIADIIKRFEGEKTFIGGGEESYGYLVGDFVREKDAVIACAMLAETAVWAAHQGKSTFELLKEIYLKYGFYKEKLISVTKKGKAGAEEIKALMDRYRNNPPLVIGNSKLCIVKDYKLGIMKDYESESREELKLPKSDVLQFITEDGSKISIRPSGTEPKIKFYFGIKDKLNTIEAYEEVDKRLDSKIEQIIKSLGIS